MEVKRKLFVLAATFIFIFLFSSFLFTPLVKADAPPMYASTGLSAELALFTQDELVVSATRQEIPISDSPSAVSVITREDITRSGMTHIPDILRRLAGVEVATQSPGYSDVNIRGLNKALSSRTLVLVDGRTVFINGQGYTPWEGIAVPVEDIKRIEVVKGPVEALYGSPALSGVINIITRNPDEVKGIESNTSVGNYETYRQSLLQGGQINDKLAYKISAEFSTADAFKGTNIIPAASTLAGTGTYLESDAWDREVVNGGLLYKINDKSNINVTGGFNNANYNILSDPATGIGATRQHSTYLNTIYTYQPGENRELQIQGFLNHDNLTATTFCLNEEAIIDVYDIITHYSFPIGKRNNVLYGAGARYEALDSNLFSTAGSVLKSEFTWDLFLQDEVKIFEKLTGFATIRFDHHPKTGFNPAYRASLVYKPIKDQMFWATIGQTFRNPTFTESMINIQYDPVGLGAFSTISTTSPEELRPEKLMSYEVGYRGLVLERIKPEVSVFYNQVSNYICALSNFGGNPLAAAEWNRGRMDIFGTEIGANVLVTDWLKTFANYTFMHVNRNDEILLDDGTPEDKGNIGASLTFGKNNHGYMLDVFSTVVGAIETPGVTGGGKIDKYQVTSTRLGYRYKDWLEASLYVYNLFKDEHVEFRGGQELGRRVVGKCSMKF